MTTFLLCFLSLILAAQANVIDQAADLQKYLAENHPRFHEKSVDGYIWHVFQADYDQDGDGELQLSGKQIQDYWVPIADRKPMGLCTGHYSNSEHTTVIS